MTQLNDLKELILAKDEALYDEIDLRIWCEWWEDMEFVSFDGHMFVYNMPGQRVETSDIAKYPKVSTSIDAQAAIMPEGWWLSVVSGGDGASSVFSGTADHGFSIKAVNMPTEPIARLLAIVLIWIWLEENDGETVHV